MNKKSKGTQGNELGRYLPDSDAKPEVEREPIQAYNRSQAQKKCEEIADSYGGTDPEVIPKGRQEFDCWFKIWR